jgi:metal-responsive CopG/Arc/MetJ family transcriptional regulator
MRTLVDIPDKQLEQLNAISETRKVSRAELVRQAIDAFLEQNRPARESAFGIWRDCKVVLPGRSEALPEDGLAYQQHLRGEW